MEITKQNHSVVVYLDGKFTAEEILQGFRSMDLGEVIQNGPEWADTLTKRPVAMFTFDKIEKAAWTKIKGRKFYRALRSESLVKNAK